MSNNSSNKNELDLDCLESVLGGLPALIRKRVEQLEEQEQQVKKLKQQLEEENPRLGEQNDVLSLNVGGARIDVLRRTLTSIEGSMLASKFSGRWDDSLEKDKDGNFFIDQPIELFLPMVNYLRSQANATPGAPVLNSPSFSGMEDTFIRMLDYYGMTLGIYPVGVFEVGKDNVVAGHPEYKVETEQWQTFKLANLAGNNYSSVKAFEIVLGNNTIAQIGWIGSSKTANFSDQDREKGVGYIDSSVALDCAKGGVASKSTPGSSRTSDEYFTQLEPTLSFGEGTVIRCERVYHSFYVNGTMVATLNKTENVQQIQSFNSSSPAIPCFTLKGSVRVSNIELQF